MSGYVKLHRQIFDSAIWYADADLLKLFVYLVGKASFTDRALGEVRVHRGEVLTSLSIIAEDCAYISGKSPRKWSKPTVRRMLERLEDPPMAYDNRS